MAFLAVRAQQEQMELLPAQPLGQAVLVAQVAQVVVSYVWLLERFLGLGLSFRSEGLVLPVLLALLVLLELLELLVLLLQLWLYITLLHLSLIRHLLPHHTTITILSTQIFMDMQ